MNNNNIIVAAALGALIIYMYKRKKTNTIYTSGIKPSSELNTNTDNDLEQQPVKSGNPPSPPTIQETGDVPYSENNIEFPKPNEISTKAIILGSAPAALLSVPIIYNSYRRYKKKLESGIGYI